MGHRAFISFTAASQVISFAFTFSESLLQSAAARRIHTTFLTLQWLCRLRPRLCVGSGSPPFSLLVKILDNSIITTHASEWSSCCCTHRWHLSFKPVAIICTSILCFLLIYENWIVFQLMAVSPGACKWDIKASIYICEDIMEMYLISIIVSNYKYIWGWACAEVSWAKFLKRLSWVSAKTDGCATQALYTSFIKSLLQLACLIFRLYLSQVCQIDLTSDLDHPWAQVWQLECGLFLVPDKRVTWAVIGRKCVVMATVYHQQPLRRAQTNACEWS